MAKVELTNNKIQIDIPDLLLGASLLKRKATLFAFTYDQMNKYLALSWRVEFFEKMADGTYGELITKQGINSYVKDVVANNSVFVDMTTGDEIVLDEEGNYVGDYTGQYDWFNMIAETMPLHVHDMIKAYGAKTNWA